MKKEIWLRHEFGERNKPEVQQLIKKHGGGAYGVYWLFKKKQYETDINKIERANLNKIASDVPQQKVYFFEVVESMIELGILIKDEKYIYFPNLKGSKDV